MTAETPKLFGTDGVRGRANRYPMTADIALRIGVAAGRYFKAGSHQHRVIIGKDTRRSSYMLETALSAGFSSMGMDVYGTGPLPTPAVGMLVRSIRADVGVMISASHNPHHDNGIKLFGPDGFKLSDEAEAEIARYVFEDPNEDLPEPHELGAMYHLEGAAARYVEFAKVSISRETRFSDLKVVLDCANGAAYKTARDIFTELGAEVIPIGVSPNGLNINEGCGSTAPELCQKTVVERGADLGVSLDGDADRVHLIDERGDIIDGDQLMALIANRFQREGRLTGGAVVATVMSNMGLERHLQGKGLKLERTRVGDRYVVERMREINCNLGGEQSGHIVMSDYGSTGDGTVAAIQAAAEIVEAGKPASEVCALFEPLPQVLKNVRYEDGADPLGADAAKAAIAEGEARLGDSGRVLIRKSGTEPLIRVMAEGEDETLVESVVDDICGAVRFA